MKVGFLIKPTFSIFTALNIHSVMYANINTVMQEVHDHFERSIDHLRKELGKVRTGKASTGMLEGIIVEYYGSQMPIAQIANIGLGDTRTITIQPWDRSAISAIEHAIFAANIGLTPQNDGEVIRLSIPALTEERRKEYVKHAKSLGEDTKVGLRSERHKALDLIKKSVKEGMSEDAGKKMEAKIQDMINDYGEKINKLVEAKEKDIMTI